jgi:hypothetical protein
MKHEDRDDGEHEEHTEAAGELSDRAAESVGRRYDATKETYHEEPEERPRD